MTAEWSVLGGHGEGRNIDDLTRLLVEGDGSWPLVIGHHNLHSLYLLPRSTALHEFFERTRNVHIDGMPIVWLARLLGDSVGRDHRVTYVDWLPRVLAEATRLRWRVYFLGSSPDACSRGLANIRARFPGITIAGRDGFFDASHGSAENTAIVAEIREFSPDLLLVGMGMPRQERWILENRDHTGAKRILPCGAAVDYVAGVVRTPPRWMGRLGMEWAFRLVQEPTRLARRYFLEPLYLIGPYMAEFMRRRFRRNRSRRSRD